MKKMWKRFWTLSKRQSGGFTLVELIVVIAILAILAGVGVPVYSGYVTKANKQADITLASEVAKALQLQYYADIANAQSGYVILTTDGVIAESDFVVAAMKAAFGENWDSDKALELKYDGWSSAATSGNVAAIDGSTFSEENLPSLLESVNGLTNVLSGFLDTGTISIPMLDDYAVANGIDPSSASGQELANIMPMLIAQNLTNKLADTTVLNDTGDTAQDKFLEAYIAGNNIVTGGSLAKELREELGLDVYTSYAVEYAQVEGMLTYLANNGSEAEKAEGQKLLNQWKTDTANLQSSYNGSGSQMVESLLSATKASILSAMESGIISESTYGGLSNQMTQDAKAFSGYMEGLNETASALLQDTDGLKSDKYYGNDNIGATVVSYLDACRSLVASGASGSAGFVLIDRNGNVQILLSE